MNTSKFERWVFQLFLRVATTPKDKKIPAQNLNTMMGILYYYYGKEEAVVYLNSDNKPLLEIPDSQKSNKQLQKSIIYIKDFQNYIDEAGNKYHSILIHKPDPDEVDPSLIDTENRSSRNVDIETNEAVGRSAHLLIEENAQPDGSHRAILEHTVGISRGVILSLFNALIEEFCHLNVDYTFRKKVKKEHVTEQFIPKIIAEAPKCASFTNDAKSGVVSGIDLIKRKPSHSGADHSDKIYPQTATLSYKVDPETPLASIKQFLSLKSKDKSFDEIRVQITEIHGKSATLRMDRALFQAQEILYTRKQVLSDFSEELSSACYDELQSELVDKMAKAMQENLWK